MKNKNLLIAGGVILVVGIAGFLIYKKMKKSSGEKSPDSKPTDSSTTTGGSTTSKLSEDEKLELSNNLKSTGSAGTTDLDVEITVNVIENALNSNEITKDDIKKYIDILIKFRKNPLGTLSKEDSDLLKDFKEKIKKYSIQKVSLESTDGKNATFKVYRNDKPVVVELKKDNSIQLENKFKDFSLNVVETESLFQIDLKKDNKTINSWSIDKKTNDIKRLR